MISGIVAMHDRRAEVRDDEEQFQERREVDAAVGTAAGDVPLGIVENRLIQQSERRPGRRWRR
jgi:hypothetical protein